MQHHECTTVSSTEKMLAAERQAVGTNGRHVNGPGEFHRLRVEYHYPGWMLDVGKDLVGRSIVDRPAGTARQWDRLDHLHCLESDHGRRAMLTRGIPDVEDVQAAARGVVGQPVGSLTNAYLALQRLIRAAEDADASAPAIRGEEQVLLTVDQHARYPR